jgi:hypothetical protein
VSVLADLFPAGDYRFHLTLRRGEPPEFFQSRDPSGRIVAERARWLVTEPARYAALTPEGAPLLEEFSALCGGWGLLHKTGEGAGGVTDDSPPACSPASPGLAQMLALGSALEPDILLLSPDAAGQFRLRGGALCFPTGWALEEKLGHTLDFIHGVVPGLNAALASPIQQFLTRLKPGVAFYRDNWGLAATDELNLHPARGLPAPDLPTAPDRLWLRVEHQCLLALPRSGGVVFALRIALHRLDEVIGDRAAADGLRQALLSMPTEVAAYKRLDRVSNQVVSWL